MKIGRKCNPGCVPSHARESAALAIVPKHGFRQSRLRLKSQLSPVCLDDEVESFRDGRARRGISLRLEALAPAYSDCPANAMKRVTVNTYQEDKYVWSCSAAKKEEVIAQSMPCPSNEARLETSRPSLSPALAPPKRSQSPTPEHE